MAIYSLRFQPIERGAGRSVVAAAAYRAGVALTDERLAMDFDYSRRRGVVHEVVLAPPNCPPQLRDREALWNAAELADRRKDSTPAREILVALPDELTADQRRHLVESFALESLVKRGMIADIAIHAPSEKGDVRNHHAHILVTTRTVGPEGFSGKNRNWDGRDFLIDLRREWAEAQNIHLGLHAPETAKVSEKSLADQGLDREPTQHLGPEATAMERRGEQTERGENNRDIEAQNAGLEQQDRRLDRQVGDAWRAGDWVRRPTDEVLQEMESARADMVRQRDGWAKERAAIEVVRPPSLRRLEAELTAEAAKATCAAEGRADRQGSSAQQRIIGEGDRALGHEPWENAAEIPRQMERRSRPDRRSAARKASHPEGAVRAARLDEIRSRPRPHRQSPPALDRGRRQGAQPAPNARSKNETDGEADRGGGPGHPPHPARQASWRGASRNPQRRAHGRWTRWRQCSALFPFHVGQCADRGWAYAGRRGQGRAEICPKSRARRAYPFALHKDARDPADGGDRSNVPCAGYP